MKIPDKYDEISSVAVLVPQFDVMMREAATKIPDTIARSSVAVGTPECNKVFSKMYLSDL